MSRLLKYELRLAATIVYPQITTSGILVVNINGLDAIQGLKSPHNAPFSRRKQTPTM